MIYGTGSSIPNPYLVPMISKLHASVGTMTIAIIVAAYFLNSPQPAKSGRYSEVNMRIKDHASQMATQDRDPKKRVEHENDIRFSVGDREAGPMGEFGTKSGKQTDRNVERIPSIKGKDRKVASKRRSANEVAGHEPERELELSVGVRLADDVRLPAAALPVDFKMSPVAEKMLNEIVNDYYRELSAAVVTDANEALEGEDEPTVVVSNGAIAEAARQRADYRFRALFGNAAYNRMTMYSALESRLPVARASE